MLFELYDYNDLIKDIEILDNLVRNFESYKKIHGEDWSIIQKSINEIKLKFKSTRFPNSNLYKNNLTNFYEIRSRAFEHKNAITEENAQYLYDKIIDMLKSCLYLSFVDFISLGVLKTSKNEMIEKGKTLKAAILLFSQNKMILNKTQKDEIFELIAEVKDSHQSFWSQYNESKDELLQKKIDEIEERISKNQDKLQNQKDYLEKLNSKKEELEEKINSSNSNSWTDKASEWLSDLEDKIEKCEEFIEKIESWLETDLEKLNNMR